MPPGESDPVNVRFYRSRVEGKKYTAVFDLRNGRQRTVHFGAAGMSDYTKHRDDARKERYLKRHRPNENWDDPLTAGALSRWVLWNKKTLRDSKADFMRRFRLGEKYRTGSKKI
jgi:hypothetical protein